MVQYDIVYEGELRCSVTHQPSQTRITTDAPTDNHGRGESFSPTDLVAAGLGVCMMTVMGIAARREGVTLDGSAVHVSKHMSADPPRRIERVSIHIRFASGIPGEKRSGLEHIARTCPVAKSIHPDIHVDLRFEYPD